MGRSQLKSCSRCNESVCAEVDLSCRCQTCGFSEEGMSSHVNSIESMQERDGRTFDLVEIFNLINSKTRIENQ